jgi:hypothetical protein
METLCEIPRIPNRRMESETEQNQYRKQKSKLKEEKTKESVPGFPVPFRGEVDNGGVTEKFGFVGTSYKTEYLRLREE